MLAHSVYFSLKDPSEPAVNKLVGACQAYLSSHPGTVYFGCGTLEPTLARPVNDRDFDVALIVVFESKVAHDAYQEAPLHQKFIAENRETWANVRVFDAIFEGA